MGSTVEISSALVLRMMRMVRIATLCDDGEYRVLEHCGILRGRDRRITNLTPARNVAADPERSFEIDPRTLIDAHKRQRHAGGLTIMGWFHTHPSGSIAPSQRDAEMADPDGSIWAIASNEGAMLWRAVPNGAMHGRFDHIRFDLRIGSKLERDREAVSWRGMELERLVKMNLEAKGDI